MTAAARGRGPIAAVLAAAVAAVLAAGCTPSVDVVADPGPSLGVRDVRAERPAAPAREITVLRQAWRFATYPGHVLTTPNYRIYTTITEESILQRLPVFLEHAMTHYTTALADLPPPRRRVESFVFRDRRQWRAKTRQLLPQEAGNFENLGRGGFTTRGISVLYFIDWGPHDKDTFAIAAHEGWHQYTQSTFRNPLPTWLEEGIATYMEGYEFRTNTAVPRFDPQKNWERAHALREAIRTRRLIPLHRLLRNAPQDFLSEGKDQLLTYYAQVWALTRFLAEGADGRYREDLARALRDAAGGRLIRRLARAPAVLARDGRSEALGTRTGPWLILAYFTSDLETFEDEYLAYARRIAR